MHALRACVRKDGTALIQKLSSGAPLRALFQPELQQFQAAFDEAVAEAVETVGSGIAVVIVVYAGEVLHSTGEWLLADSTFSGEQLQMWLDSEAASKLTFYRLFCCPELTKPADHPTTECLPMSIDPLTSDLTNVFVDHDLKEMKYQDFSREK
ncbi:hypothetical protein ACTXT7_005014 [Hymenolepis weldensis]